LKDCRVKGGVTYYSDPCTRSEALDKEPYLPVCIIMPKPKLTKRSR
jgi:hypothetical protein